MQLDISRAGKSAGGAGSQEGFVPSSLKVETSFESRLASIQSIE